MQYKAKSIRKYRVGGHYTLFLRGYPIGSELASIHADTLLQMLILEGRHQLACACVWHCCSRLATPASVVLALSRLLTFHLLQ